MTIRSLARVAGLAVLAAEATGVSAHADALSKPGVWIVLAVVQLAVVLWVTDRRTAPVLRTVAPAALTAVTATAAWTTIALAAPVITTGNAAALVAIATVGLVVAVAGRGAGRRLLPRALFASAGAALLIFLVITMVLPSVPGFVSNSHPPIYPARTRMADPIGELGLFVLLVAALGADWLRGRIRTHRAAARDRGGEYGAGPNEMVVTPTG